MSMQSAANLPWLPVGGIDETGSWVYLNQPITFTLRKADNVELGLNISICEGTCGLRVEGVLPGGAVDAWNKVVRYGDKVVRSGDTISSVNGIKNDPDKMLIECRAKRLVKLTLARQQNCTGGGLVLSEAASEPTQQVAKEDADTPLIVHDLAGREWVTTTGCLKKPTVEFAKAWLENVSSVPRNEQRLLAGERELKDSETLVTSPSADPMLLTMIRVERECALLLNFDLPVTSDSLLEFFAKHGVLVCLAGSPIYTAWTHVVVVKMKSYEAAALAWRALHGQLLPLPGFPSQVQVKAYPVMKRISTVATQASVCNDHAV